jgi:ATP-grasp domain
MNVVFLSPHFPPHYYRFCMNLTRAGARALGIGDADFDLLPAEVRDSLTEYYRVEDLHNYDGLLRACGFFTHKYGKIDRLDSLNEYWLATEARLRDDFNIDGIRGQDIDVIRRKSMMKEKFRSAGIPVARGAVVHTMEEALRLIEEIGYPVVAKPDAGVGALNTYRIDSQTDLVRFFADKSEVDYIIEEFISGTIYSFDGLADGAGKPVFFTSHVFSQGIMETVNEARHIYYYSLREIPPVLEDFGHRCLREFGVRERFFHIEFFRTGPDRFVALEVNLRPPGGFTTDMFNYACDIDVYRAWAELLASSRSELDYERKYHCCYVSRKSGHPYVYRHADILERYGAYILQAESVPGVFSSALGDIGYIFRAESLETILEITHTIHAVQNREN